MKAYKILSKQIAEDFFKVINVPNYIISLPNLARVMVKLHEVTEGKTKRDIAKKYKFFNFNVEKLRLHLCDRFLSGKDIESYSASKLIGDFSYTDKYTRSSFFKWLKKTLDNRVVINPDKYDSNILAISINYIKGWQLIKPSEKQSSFRLPGNLRIPITMVEAKMKAKISETPEFQILRLEIKEIKEYMTIFLPKTEVITESIFSDIRFKTKQVHVRMPPFKLSSRFEFDKYLQKLGLQSITDYQEFKDLKIIQKNKFLFKPKVEEEPLEEKVYTTNKIVPISFFVDRPFYFTITNKKGLLIYFAKVTNPSL
jgi:serine protease inhibitor